MAGLFRYRLSDRQREITSEIICQRHLDDATQPGGCMDALSEREKARGYSQSWTPYTGDRPCALCEEDAYERTMKRVG